MFVNQPPFTSSLNGHFVFLEIVCRTASQSPESDPPRSYRTKQLKHAHSTQYHATCMQSASVCMHLLRYDQYLRSSLLGE